MNDIVDQQLNDFRKAYGDKELIEFIERRQPQDKDSFIRRLYADISQALSELEAQAHELQKESENKLRSRLLTVLRTYGYRASGEADHRGHTDLLVENSHVRLKWIGEAKRYDHSGYSHLMKGMRQLHTRYKSGTHKDSGFVVFVFSRNASGVVQRWRSKIEEETLCGLRGPTRDSDENPLFFWSDHLHEGSGLPVCTKHFFAALFYKPRD